MPEPDLNSVATKLAAARTRLILDKPFLGALVLRLPMLPADAAWCPTTGTDARNFYYNPAYIDSLSLAQTQFMLAHEALHCALSHFARRAHREVARWDLACDFAINPHGGDFGQVHFSVLPELSDEAHCNEYITHYTQIKQELFSRKRKAFL